MLRKVNAHTLESISGQQRYQRRILFFHLVSYVFEGFSHRVFNHLLLGLLNLLEPLIEIGENLRKKRRVRLVKGLFDRHDPLLVGVDRIDQKLDHVAA